VWAATHLVVCAVFSLACVAHGSVGEAELGRKDPGAICADETAGMALTLALCPPQAIGQGLAAWPVVAGAFLAFRLADILKPWPAGALQAAHAGWGILLDDLAAAGYAAAAVWIAWSAGWLPLL
jgi:phosphatidylglycerophosphatase A